MSNENVTVKEWYLDQAAIKPVAGEQTNKPADKEKSEPQSQAEAAETGVAEVKSEAAAAEGTACAKKSESSNPIVCVTVRATPLDLSRPPAPVAPAAKKVAEQRPPEAQQSAEQPSAAAPSEASAAAAPAADTEQAAKSASEEEAKSEQAKSEPAAEQPAQPTTTATTAAAAAMASEPAAAAAPEQPSVVSSPRLEDLWFNSASAFNEARIRALLFCLHNEAQWPLTKLLNLDMLPPSRMAACLVLRYRILIYSALILSLYALVSILIRTRRLPGYGVCMLMLVQLHAHEEGAASLRARRVYRHDHLASPRPTSLPAIHPGAPALHLQWLEINDYSTSHTLHC